MQIETRDRGGEIRGETWAPTPVDSKETWTPFFNKPTLHVSGTLCQPVHSAPYPKQHESRRILISTAWDVLCHIGFAEVRFVRCVMSGHQGSVNTIEMASENVRTRWGFLWKCQDGFCFLSHSAELSHKLDLEANVLTLKMHVFPLKNERMIIMYGSSEKTHAQR